MSLLSLDIEAKPSDSSVCPDDEMIFQAFMQLLPRGAAWDNVEFTSDRHSTIRKFMYALAMVWRDFEDAQCAALNEWFCITASTDLDAWNADYGIPDECDLYNADTCAKVVTGAAPTIDNLTKLLEANGYIGQLRWLTGDDLEYPGVHSTLLAMVDPGSPAFALGTSLPFPLGEAYAFGIGVGELEQVRCMLERYVPAHCVINLQSAGTFHPLDLNAAGATKLRLWWHADDSVDGEVLSWVDRIKGFNAAGVAGTTAPTSSIIDGRRWITFGGADKFVRTTGTLALVPVGSDPYGVFSHVKKDVNGAAAQYFYSHGANNNLSRRAGIRYTAGFKNVALVFSTSGFELIDTATDIGLGDGIIYTRFGTTQFGRTNGNPFVPSSMAVTGLATGASLITIGGGAGSPPANDYQGRMRQLMVTDGTLTTQQIMQLEGWIAWDSDAQDSLHPDHPYKEVRP